MPHGGVPNARSLTARDANRAIIKCFCDARHLRTVSERSGTIFTIVRSGTVERAPASYASRRIEWVQPQFGSGARGQSRKGDAAFLAIPIRRKLLH